MSSINKRGDILHGVGGGFASLNNNPFNKGGDPYWMTEDTAAYANGEDNWIIWLRNFVTGAKGRAILDPTNRYFATPANSVYAGGGVWAAWNNLSSENRGLFSSTGFSSPTAGLFGVGPDGTIGYKPDYNSMGPSMAHPLDGPDWQISAGHCSDLQLLGDKRAVWHERNLIRAVGIPIPLQVGRAYRPRAYFVNGVWFISYYSDQMGIVLHPFNDPSKGFSITPPGVDAWYGSELLADGMTVRFALSVHEGEQPGEVTHHDVNLDVEPMQDLIRPITIPRIARPIWLGFLEFGPGPDSPGNMSVIIRNITGVLKKPYLSSIESEGKVSGKCIGQWFGGATVEEIEAKAVAYPNPVAYWDDRNWPRWPKLPLGSWLCIRGYCRANETPEAFETDLRQIIASVPAGQLVALIAQCYTNNTNNTTDLRGLVPVFARLARDCQNVIAILGFSGAGRDTGLTSHPEVRPLWEELAAGIPRPPVFIEGNMSVNPKITVKEFASQLKAGVAATIVKMIVGDTEVLVYKDASDNLVISAANTVGSDQTGSIRHITVVGAATVPPPAPVPVPVPIPVPAPTPTEGVTLQTANGAFLRIGPNKLIDAKGDEKSAARFIVKNLPGGKSALLAVGSGFLRAPGGADKLYADRQDVDIDESFTLVRTENRISIQARLGMFASAEEGGHGDVNVNRPGTDSWEQFLPSGPFGGNAAFTGPLSTVGKIFLANGIPWRWRGVSAFQLLNRYAAGEDITPFLSYYSGLGFNVLRVWPYVPTPPWNPGWDVTDVDTTRRFLDLCKSYGFYVEITLLTDDSSIKRDWAKGYVQALSAPRPDNLVLEIGNEPNTNKHIDTAALRDVCNASGLLYSSGDYDDEGKWFGKFGTDHSGRDNEWMRKGHNLMEFYEGNGPETAHPPYRVPWVEDEPIRPDQCGYNAPAYYAYAAVCSLLGAGATMHLETGKVAMLPTAQEIPCVEAFIQGLTIFPADAPLGGYSRPVENSLRTYVVGSYMARVSPNGDAPSGWRSLGPFNVAYSR